MDDDHNATGLGDVTSAGAPSLDRSTPIHIPATPPTRPHARLPRSPSPSAGSGSAPPIGAFSPAELVHSVAEAESLGCNLGPSVQKECEGRIGEIEWFKAPWQRSGAATGRTLWNENGETVRAVVKVPVGYREWFWTTQINRHSEEAGEHCPVPRVLAGGTELNGYDVAWLVVERIKGKPSPGRMSEAQVGLMLDAAARFHAIAAHVKPISEGPAPVHRDWSKLLASARRAAEDNPIPEQHRWLRGIDRVIADLDRFETAWEARPIDTWCHGDLHPGNVICLGKTPGKPRDCMLLDLALVHAGHWLEDALYVERLYWGREHLLDGVDPVEHLVQARLGHGLATSGDVAEIAAARRVLMAVTSPAALARFGDPVYLEAALDRLERGLAG
ncbi:MAG: phosphotransferase [Planctomycetota bacterium]